MIDENPQNKQNTKHQVFSVSTFSDKKITFGVDFPAALLAEPGWVLPRLCSPLSNTIPADLWSIIWYKANQNIIFGKLRS